LKVAPEGCFAFETKQIQKVPLWKDAKNETKPIFYEKTMFEKSMMFQYNTNMPSDATLDANAYAKEISSEEYSLCTICGFKDSCESKHQYWNRFGGKIAVIYGSKLDSKETG